MDIGDAVAGHAQHLFDVLRAADRAAVQRHHVLGLVRAQLVQALDPHHRVTELGAAQGVDIRQGRPLLHLGADQHAVVRQVDDDLVRRLAGHMQELQVQAGDTGVELVLEGQGRGDKGRGLDFGQRADAGVHLLMIGGRQPGAEAVAGAHRENRPDQRALRHHIGQQGLVGDDLHLTAAHLLFGDEGLHAIDMVRVEVGVDHRLDRLVADLAELGHDLARLADRLAGIDDDQPFRGLDHRHVAQLPADGGIDVTGHLVDLLHKMLGVLGQLRVDRRADLFFGQRGLAGQGYCQAQQHGGSSSR